MAVDFYSWLGNEENEYRQYLKEQGKSEENIEIDVDIWLHSKEIEYKNWLDTEETQNDETTDEVGFIDIKKQSKKELKYGKQFQLAKKWEELFNQSSYYNEIPAKIFFRVLLSTLLKNIEIYKYNGTKLNMVLHHFMIQTSGSGKDQAFDLLLETCREINKRKPNLVRVCELSGAESPESFLDQFATKKTKSGENYDFDTIVSGILSNHDLIISRECSFLFVEKRGDKQVKSEYLLISLEGRYIEKSLKTWQGHKTVTVPNFCFIGTTRPIANMKQHIVQSGLQQRAINYMRDIDIDLRKKMMQKVCMHAFGNKGNEVLRRNMISAFVDELLDFYDYVQNNNTEIIAEEPEELNKLVYNNIRSILEDINNTLGNEEHKDIMNSFIARIIDITLVLSYQNALLRRDTIVKVIDVQLAIDEIIKGSIEQIKVWVEDTIEEDQKKLYKLNGYKMTILNYYKTRQFAKRKELATFLSKKSLISYTYAYNIIKKFATGNNKILYLEQDKLYLIDNKKFA